MFQIDISEKTHKEIWEDLGIIIPHLKSWLGQQRWSGLSNVKNFELNTDNFFTFKEASSHKILGFFLNIDTGNDSTQFFLPLIFFPNDGDFDHVPEIRINTQTSPISLSQAECSPIFIEHLMEDFKRSKSYDLNKGILFTFELENGELIRNFEFESSSVFKRGETTNFLTKVKGKPSNLFLKSYRKFSISREPILIKELHDSGFKNIPRPIGFAKLTNGKQKVCFYLQEFIPFQNDLGYYFWDDLNFRLKYPLNRTAMINNAKLNKDLLNLIELMIDFHVKSFNSRNPLFERELFTRQDINAFKNSQLKIIESILKQKDESLKIFNDIADKFKKIQDDIKHLGDFIGFYKITVHQDLHLAQILVKNGDKIDKECYITDLEGDPNRPVNETWKKDLIFRDLASIITAFNYIKVNSIMRLYDIPQEKLKLIEKLSEIYSVLKVDTEFGEANTWTSYLTKTFIEFYYDKFFKSMDLDKKIDLVTFRKGVEIYTFDRLIREIFYELKFRRDNFVVPLIILNNEL